MKINRFLFLALLSIALFSCQNNLNKKKAATLNSQQIATEIQKDLPASTPQKEHPGKAVYDDNCLSCHQADGSGVPGMHPPLGPGSWVGKQPQELIAIMMKGLSGKIEVNGEIYNDAMPSHAQLSDEEIANVLSYVRSSFGNNFEAITPEMVKNIRNGK